MDLDDDEDDEGSDDEVTAPCPHCGARIYDDAERCPECEAYLSREDAPWKKPLWVVVGVLVCLWLVRTWNFGW